MSVVVRTPMLISDAVLTWVISLLLLALMAGIAWVVIVVVIRRFTSRYGGTSIGDAARIAIALKMPRQMDVRGLSRSLSRRAIGLRLELPGKRTVLPSAVTVGCSDYDYEVLEPVRSLVGESIAEHLVAKARQRN